VQAVATARVGKPHQIDLTWLLGRGNNFDVVPNPGTKPIHTMSDISQVNSGCSRVKSGS